MPINTTVRQAGPFNVGPGYASMLPFHFKVFTREDVLVLYTPAGGVEAARTLGTHYFVTLNANQDTNPGGSVQLAAPSTLGGTIIVSSAIPETQPAEWTSLGGFNPQTITRAFDRVTAIVQQFGWRLGRVEFKSGDKGPVGDKGPLGDKGATGDKGPVGDKGPQGDPGSVSSVAWADVTDKPAAFPPSAHDHAIASVTGLAAALAAKQATLVSGTNIKTVGGVSLLGAGDIPVGGGSLPIQSVNSNTTAVKGNAYLMTASLTLTLPASPAVDDEVAFINASGTVTCVIARNGSLLMGLPEDMTVSKLNVGETLVYTGPSKGWWVR